MGKSAYDYQKMLMEQRDKCAEIMRRDSAELKREMDAGVRSFHSALAAHRDEERGDRRDDRKATEEALTRIHVDLKGTLEKIEAKVETNKDSHATLALAVGRNTAWRKVFLWLIGGGSLASVVAGGIRLLWVALKR